ncbi:hypothetical protein RJ641_015084 [Dillenia turbinata]|uniref:Uncharacterized protein n=1 Tax=Dillenia turbinata TaxID=194707 RepID=A0AAN8Z1S2_9MAGN
MRWEPRNYSGVVCMVTDSWFLLTSSSSSSLCNLVTLESLGLRTQSAWQQGVVIGYSCVAWTGIIKKANIKPLVQYLSLLIIDELFMRLKFLRSLLVLLSLSVGFKRNLPLPAPPAIASTLRSKAIEFLEKWNASFGFHYRQLRMGDVAQIQQERRERELRTKEILLNKFEILKENFTSIKSEIQLTIDEIG